MAGRRYRMLADGDPDKLSAESFRAFGELAARRGRAPVTLWVLESDEELSAEGARPLRPLPDGTWEAPGGRRWRRLTGTPGGAEGPRA